MTSTVTTTRSFPPSRLPFFSTSLFISFFFFLSLSLTSLCYILGLPLVRVYTRMCNSWNFFGLGVLGCGEPCHSVTPFGVAELSPLSPLVIPHANDIYCWTPRAQLISGIPALQVLFDTYEIFCTTLLDLYVIHVTMLVDSGLITLIVSLFLAVFFLENKIY